MPQHISGASSETIANAEDRAKETRRDRAAAFNLSAVAATRLAEGPQKREPWVGPHDLADATEMGSEFGC